MRAIIGVAVLLVFIVPVRDADAAKSCDSAELPKICEEHKELLWKHLIRTSRYSTSSQSDKFIAALPKVDGWVKRLNTFKSEWGHCVTKKKKPCMFTSYNWEKIPEAVAKINAKVPKVAEDVVAQAKKLSKTVADDMQQKDYSHARGIIKRDLPGFEALSKLFNNAALNKEIAALHAQVKKLEALEFKQLTKVRCAKGRRRNKRLEKKLKTTLQAWLDAKSAKYKTSVKQLQIDSKVKREKKVDGTKWEYLNAVVCHEPAKAPTMQGEKICMSEGFSFHRKKSGRKWSPWEVRAAYSGGSGKVLCKNVK